MPLSKQGPKVHSVTGSAHTIEPSTGKSFEYTVNALEHGGTSFSGQYQLNVHGTDPFYNKLHGKVMSLKIWDGNKASIVSEVLKPIVGLLVLTMRLL